MQDRLEQKVERALGQLHPRNLKHLAQHLQKLTTSRLWAQILLGMALGIAVGVMLGPTAGWVAPATGRVIGDWLALPGMLFLSLIQMIVIPLIITAIIRGFAASNDAEQLKKNGVWLGLYFVATTMVATTIGIGLAFLLKPGSYIDPASMQAAAKSAPAVAAPAAESGVDLTAFPEKVISIFPTNPLLSMVEGQMLQIVLFSILIGIALLNLEAKSAKPILEILGAVQELTMKIVGWAMRLAPFAVFGLLARQMVTTGIDALVGLAAYVGTFLLGMVALLVVYLVVVRLLGDGRPLRFLRGAKDAQLLAFSTDSSAATMPVTIKVAEEELGVRPSVSQFVIPIGASVNMGGSALYQGLATVFMAQIYGMDLSLAALLALVVTALGASIGTPATPGVGIVVLATVLTSAGVPVAGLGLILGVDQILERFRTVLNVTGDLAACTVMDRRVETAKSRDQELEEAKAREALRQRRGGDVVLGQ
jgi:Na+/H+-dicarboxylate symporter